MMRRDEGILHDRNTDVEQGIIGDLKDYFGGFVSENKHRRFDQILQHRTYYLQVVLDTVEDPLDANAAFRSCECFGIQKVHWLQSEGKRNMRRGISVGATKWLDLDTTNSQSAACATQLRTSGMRQFALSTREDALTPDQIPLDRPLALWFASERSGIKPETDREMDGFLRLPMVGAGSHFNFSVAVALALQAMTRRLHQSDVPWQMNPVQKDHCLLEWFATIPKKRTHLLQRFLESRHMDLAALAPPVTTKRFWDMVVRS